MNNSKMVKSVVTGAVAVIIVITVWYVSLEKTNNTFTSLSHELATVEDDNNVISGEIESIDAKSISVSGTVSGTQRTCNLAPQTVYRTFLNSKAMPKKGDVLVVTHLNGGIEATSAIAHRGVTLAQFQGTSTIPATISLGEVTQVSGQIVSIKTFTGKIKSFDLSRLASIFVEIHNKPELITAGDRTDVNCVKGNDGSWIALVVSLYR